MDNVLGAVYIKDLIGVSPDNEGALLTTAQPVQLVPETTRISNGLLASRCTSRWGNEMVMPAFFNRFLFTLISAFMSRTGRFIPFSIYNSARGVNG